MSIALLYSARGLKTLQALTCESVWFIHKVHRTGPNATGAHLLVMYVIQISCSSFMAADINSKEQESAISLSSLFPSQ